MRNLTKSLVLGLLLAPCLALFAAAGSLKQKIATLEPQMAPRTPVEAPGLAIRWFGAASIVIDDGTHAILIDPFVTRGGYSKAQVVFGPEVPSDKDLIAHYAALPDIRRTRAILVGHSHYDHIMDVADFARETGAPVYAAADAARILTAHHPEVGFSCIGAGAGCKTSLDLGPFTVTVLRGAHGRPPALIDPLRDTVPWDFDQPTNLRRYGRGEVFAFHIAHALGNILHIGSAGTKDSLGDLGKTDVLLLPLVGRGNTARYLDKTVAAARPRYVIPIHYDDIFQPLSDAVETTIVARPARFFEVMQGRHKGVKTGIIPLNERWTYSQGTLGLSPAQHKPEM